MNPSRIPGMTTITPDPTPESIAALAAEVWELRAEISRLGGWEDSNYRLRTDDGRAFVLKIAPVTTRRETLENQTALLKHLASGGLSALVPRTVPTAAGRSLHRVKTGDGTARWARLLTYLEGRRLLDVDERPPQLLEEIGRALAGLDLSLKSFDHPASRSSHEWDPMATPDLAHMAGDIPNPAQRKLVENHLHRFSSVVLPHRSELEHGVIHSDANDHNLLVRAAAEGPRLAGIIDFSDALISPVVADLGICLAYLMLDRADPFADAAYLIRGYNEVRPLSILERELLPDFVLIRICTSVLHAAHGFARDPENAYLQISAAPMWRLFEILDTSPNDHFPRTVEAACS